MDKRTVLDQIEFTRDGGINLRIAKEILDDDGTVLSCEYWRRVIAAGEDVDLALISVNEAITQSRYPAIGTETLNRVRAAAALT